MKVSTSDLQEFRPRYREASIPKRTGGKRLLQIPDAATLEMQRRILRLLLSRVKSHPNAYGFERDRSIADNAAKHTRQAAVVRLDIKDFFPNTRVASVTNYFRRLGWDAASIEFLVRATTHQKGLPQGAPTSPRLSNLVNFFMDRRLSGLASVVSATYTRYADDLTFSFDPQHTRRHYRFRGMTLWQRVRVV